jgi:pimeloyl-ACP methyl ester carboxylesterase
MKDGTRLNGWVVKNAPGGKSPLLIYFSANAEEASRLVPKVSTLQGWTVALINYRGYGDSEGKPGERELFSDALEIYDLFTSRADIDRTAVSVMGRSIGTGVATYLAAHRPVASVILVSPYDTMLDVAKTHFPFLPVELIFKYRFDSLSLAPSIQASLLVLVGSNDSLIPKQHSKKLADAWGGPVEFEEIAGAGHNTVDDTAEYWDLIERFLKQK